MLLRVQSNGSRRPVASAQPRNQSSSTTSQGISKQLDIKQEEKLESVSLQNKCAHVNEMIYNRGDLAWRSLAIATVAANASGATWKGRKFVNFVFCSAEFCKFCKNRKWCMFEHMFVNFGFCSAEFCYGLQKRKLC